MIVQYVNDCSEYHMIWRFGLRPRQLSSLDLALQVCLFFLPFFFLSDRVPFQSYKMHSLLKDFLSHKFLFCVGEFFSLHGLTYGSSDRFLRGHSGIEGDERCAHFIAYPFSAAKCAGFKF